MAKAYNTSKKADWNRFVHDLKRKLDNKSERAKYQRSFVVACPQCNQGAMFQSGTNVCPHCGQTVEIKLNNNEA